MANELKVTSRIQYTPTVTGMQSVDTGSIEFYVTMAGSDYVSLTQEIGTTEEALDIPTDIGTAGYILIKNLDSTNFVEVGLTASYTIKLKAGEVALFRADSNSLYAKADTANVNVQLYIFED